MILKNLVQTVLNSQEFCWVVHMQIRFFFFFFFTLKFFNFLQIVLLIPNSTWRTLLAISINYKADLLTNSISLETSPIDFTAYSLYFYLLFGIQYVHIGGGRRVNKLRYISLFAREKIY